MVILIIYDYFMAIDDIDDYLGLFYFNMLM